MLRYFLKIPPLKRILQFKDRSCFFIKNTKKTTTLQQMTGGKTPNLVLKKIVELFLKIPPLKKILKFLRLKEECNTYTKNENLKLLLNQ